MHWRQSKTRGQLRQEWNLIPIGGPATIHATILFDFKRYRVLIAEAPGLAWTTWEELDPCDTLEAAEAAGKAAVEARTAGAGR